MSTALRRLGMGATKPPPSSTPTNPLPDIREGEALAMVAREERRRAREAAAPIMLGASPVVPSAAPPAAGSGDGRCAAEK